MHKARLLSGDIYIAQVFSQRFIRILPLISELKRTSGVFAEIAWAGIVSYLLLYMLASHNAPGVSKKQSRPTSSITIIHDLIQQAMVLLTYRVKMEQKVQLLTPIMNCKSNVVERLKEKVQIDMLKHMEKFLYTSLKKKEGQQIG
ncbi:uncharacterized protein LOC127262794 isoform X2 [Andrographis paniculata]|uniref:uncharacterized protein LOC127262794 isoform X2 n=1 Tax=Andrographis paniculata TaxID=175694 RepID=UPI0021E87FD6|nr:uncharacterized protein LOC127262794 isoform X2 [Andrographis paniculata]